MVNCWNELAENRPTFPDLVREFDSMISMLSEKVKIMVTAPFKVFRQIIITKISHLDSL